MQFEKRNRNQIEARQKKYVNKVFVFILIRRFKCAQSAPQALQFISDTKLALGVFVPTIYNIYVFCLAYFFVKSL